MRFFGGVKQNFNDKIRICFVLEKIKSQVRSDASEPKLAFCFMKDALEVNLKMGTHCK